MNIKRSVGFRRSASQEALLADLNGVLAHAEEEYLRRSETPVSPQRPIVFVVGAPRSGTTVTMQWLAASGQFGYPSNLIARFYAAPFVAGQIHRLLTDPIMDFHDELAGRSDAAPWQSDVGKTAGIGQPHEYSYFWRRFFPMDQARRLTSAEWAASDLAGFARGWALLEAALDRPLAAKGILGQYNLLELAELLPTAVFLFTRRDPFFNVQSLLLARERVSGSRGEWFSVQPPGWEDLLDRDPIEQVVGQVLITNGEIERQLQSLPAHRSIEQSYDDFCRDPSTTWTALQQAFATQGQPLPDLPDQQEFANTNRIRLEPDEVKAVRRAIAESHR